MEDLTWEEFRDRARLEPVILPVGSTEQHAPHLPLGTDVIISRGIGVMLARRVGALVAPAVCYGYKSQPGSGGGPLFPGTISLDGVTLTLLVRDVLRELIGDGVQKILVLNGHFENDAFLMEAADLAVKDLPPTAPRPKVLVASWWDQISPEVLRRVFSEVPFPGWALEHAAITETSLVMYLCPEKVREEKLDGEASYVPRSYSVFPVPAGFVPQSGRLSTARSSSAEKGELLARDIVENLARILESEFGGDGR